MPNLSEEKKLWKKGYKRVVGLDEAGRGPLAGPVVAAAVILNSKNPRLKNILREVDDSKKLTAKKREKLFKVLTKNPAMEWGVGIVSEKVIDRINILEATKLAMEKAIKEFNPKSSRRINYLILDGNMVLDLQIPQKSIIKADQKVMSCAAASIIAKVTRDRIMDKYHKKFPKYGFNKHKGYGTKHHFKMIRKYGDCPIHRKSFSY